MVSRTHYVAPTGSEFTAVTGDVSARKSASSGHRQGTLLTDSKLERPETAFLKRPDQDSNLGPAV